jgi:TonB-dependent SusC/RagA subfamily outer membrane receptor
MSVSQRSAWPFHAANILMSAAVLVSASACYPAPSEAPRLAVVEASELRMHWTNQGALHRFPGVDVVPMGQSAFVVKIHSGMVGFGEPLYVIDGAPITISSSRGIDWLKPDDIAQIKVLKYPDELTIYGPAGVNGVIVITTKQAAGKSGAAY